MGDNVCDLMNGHWTPTGQVTGCGVGSAWQVVLFAKYPLQEEELLVGICEWKSN